MNELNKKLAEWAGFKRQEHKSQFHPQAYILPSGRKGYVPNFTQSLDAVFQWLVPKLWDIKEFRLLSYQWVGFSREIDLLRHSWGIHLESDVSYHASEREPALALCKAIEKLIDSEAK